MLMYCGHSWKVELLTFFFLCASWDGMFLATEVRTVSMAQLPAPCWTDNTTSHFLFPTGKPGASWRLRDGWGWGLFFRIAPPLGWTSSLGSAQYPPCTPVFVHNDVSVPFLPLGLFGCFFVCWENKLLAARRVQARQEERSLGRKGQRKPLSHFHKSVPQAINAIKLLVGPSWSISLPCWWQWVSSAYSPSHQPPPVEGILPGDFAASQAHDLKQ